MHTPGVASGVALSVGDLITGGSLSTNGSIICSDASRVTSYFVNCGKISIS